MPKSRTQAASKTQLLMKEPYIDHLEEIGKAQIARHREKEREITTKNFIVNTSTLNTVMHREQTL